MSVAENRAIIRRGVEEGWNKGNADIFDEIVASEVVHHNWRTRGLEAFKQAILADMTAFPDLQMTIEDMIAEGDKVVVRYTFRGTQQGETLGIPPTGKHVTVPGIFVCRCENGKIVEEWDIWDELGLLRQLGAISPPG
jgi:steroid delta-isomerase-like uncharacterized protein